MQKIGYPPRTVLQWLVVLAEDNETAAALSFNPLTRIRCKARAEAFRTAIKMTIQADRLSMQFPPHVPPVPPPFQFPEPPETLNTMPGEEFWKF